MLKAKPAVVPGQKADGSRGVVGGVRVEEDLLVGRGVGSGDVEVALGQPSRMPALQETSPVPDKIVESTVTTGDPKSTHDPRRRSPGGIGGGPGRPGMLSSTPGRPPALFFKKLSGPSEESGDEEESSGVFPVLTPSSEYNPLTATRFATPPLTLQNPPPVVLAYSSPYSSRRSTRERRKTSSPTSLSAAQATLTENNGSEAAEPVTTPGGPTGGDAHRAPVSTVGPTLLRSAPDKAAPAGASPAGAKTAALALLFEPRGAFVAGGITKDPQPGRSAGVQSATTATTPFVASSPSAKVQPPAPEGEGVSGRHQASPPIDATSYSVPASMQASPVSTGRSVSLKAAAILGFTTLDQAAAGNATTAVTAPGDRALSMTESDSVGGRGWKSPRGSFAELLGRFRTKKTSVSSSEAREVSDDSSRRLSRPPTRQRGSTKRRLSAPPNTRAAAAAAAAAVPTLQTAGLKQQQTASGGEASSSTPRSSPAPPASSVVPVSGGEGGGSVNASAATDAVQTDAVQGKPGGADEKSCEAPVVDAVQGKPEGAAEKKCESPVVGIKGKAPEEDVEEKQNEEEVVEDKEEEPEVEVVFGPTMRLKGRLECGHFLRMEGIFEGHVVSTGSIVVAPTGKITGDLKGLKFLLVQGQVMGDVVCDKVMVIGDGKVIGNISATSISLGPQSTTRGMLNVVKNMSELAEEDSMDDNLSDDTIATAEDIIVEDAGVVAAADVAASSALENAAAGNVGVKADDVSVQDTSAVVAASSSDAEREDAVEDTSAGIAATADAAKGEVEAGVGEGVSSGPSLVEVEDAAVAPRAQAEGFEEGASAGSTPDLMNEDFFEDAADDLAGLSFA